MMRNVKSKKRETDKPKSSAVLRKRRTESRSMRLSARERRSERRKKDLTIRSGSKESNWKSRRRLKESNRLKLED